MTIETILEYLNAVSVRATYGAVGDVLGVRPQVVPRLLGAPRPEASWIVNGSTGEPTGYTPDQADPRLAGTPVIRTGDELRRGLERHAAAAAEAAPPAAEPAPPAAEPAPPAAEPAPPAAEPAYPVNGMAGMGRPETEAIEIGSDAKWIIGTLVPVFLLVAGLLAAQIASVSDSLNGRMDAVNDRIDDLQADLEAQIGGVDTRIGEEREALENEIAGLRDEVGSVAARLPGPAPEPADADAEPASDASEEAEDPAAPAVASEPAPEPAPEPAAPVENPAPPGE